MQRPQQRDANAKADAVGEAVVVPQRDQRAGLVKDGGSDGWSGCEVVDNEKGATKDRPTNSAPIDSASRPRHERRQASDGSANGDVVGDTLRRPGMKA